MVTINASYSIPSEEYQRLEEVLSDCEKVIEKPNMTEIIRVAIHNLITEKKPKDISHTLNQIGRKQRGRPRKDNTDENDKNANKNIETDFSQISDFQWGKIETLFSEDTEARAILSDILFDLQNAWKRNIARKQTTSKVKRWRRQQKWQESGIWTEIYNRLLPTFDKQQELTWNELFLRSFLVKRKRRKEV